MEGNIWLMLLFQVALIALNAVFACAEIAVITTGDGKLEKLSEEGDKRAKKLLKLTKNPARFLATIQVAITLAGFIGSAFAAENFSDSIVKWLMSLAERYAPETLEFAALANVLDAAAVVVITLLLSFVTLVFGELVPKRAAMRNPEKLALKMSGLVCFIGAIFKPLVWLLTVSTNCVLRLIGIDPNASDNDVSEEDIRDMVDSAAKNSQIDDEEREFIENIFEFDDLTAGDVATHRTDVTMLWTDEYEEWNGIIHEKCHMFYPVCEETVDNVVGVLYLKDYFRLEDKTREAVMEKAVKSPYFVPESVKADVLFRNMRTNGKTFAIVLDEYGGMRGIVTTNDLVARLVGDLGGDDMEPKEATESFEEVSERTWQLRGNVALDEIAEKLGVELPCDDFDTFSGMIFAELGSIPDDGETAELEAWGLSIKVSEILDHQIEAATITLLESENDENVEEE